jgi:signal transduction histidine kinase
MRSVIAFIGQILTGLRFRLLLLVVLVCTPLLVLTLHTAWEARRDEVKRMRTRSQKMTQLAAREEEKLLGETRQLLLAVAESSPVRSDNPQVCRKYLSELFASYPRYANFGVIKTNGEVEASAVPLQMPVNLTERGFLHRVLQSGGLAMGDFPAVPGAGKQTVDFGCPVFDAEGQVKAVVFASLDLGWANRLGSELPAQLTKGATWTEIDYRGRILVRYPAPEQWVGQPIPERALLNTVFNESKGVTEAVDAKGIPNVYAFAAMPSHIVSGNVVTILGVPKQVLFAEADRIAIRDLTWLGIAVGVAFVFGWLGSNLLILRPVKALVLSTARLASGDLSARTGLPHGRDELGRLTLTFDLMAQALEQRELERKRASHKLHVLSHRLVEVQETERRHIARELHDEIGQSLTVAEMNLHAALDAPRAAAVTLRLQDSIEAVERVLEQVKDLSLNLRPSMLDDLGLEPALRWYTQRQAKLSGLQARFRADPLENRVDPVIETECFRVAQEALTNVVRHAQARHVSVDLSRHNGDLQLSVRDDGVGFDVTALREEAVRGASLGLLSMEERAALAGGGFELRSSPGHGTEVRAWFPLKWRVAEAELQPDEKLS